MSKHTRETACGIVASLLFAATTAIGQTQAPSAPPTPPTSPPQPAKSIVVTGCVAADQITPDQFTMRDAKSGVTYRLHGVKIVAYENRRVRIVGGLYPTPNIAAQAGAIEPAQAATATTGPGILGSSRSLDLGVTSVRPVKGSCPSSP
jgi:hypothetical protein